MTAVSVADRCPESGQTLLPTGYGARCIAWASDGRAIDLGGHTAATADSALGWLRHRVWEVAEQLDPPALELAWRWNYDHAEQAMARAALTLGNEYGLDLVSNGVRYEFIVCTGSP